MKHTVKWLEENLGITRKTIRNYEAKGLLSSEDCRNPINNFREYDDDDIDRIWGIKLLQGVGYSLSEIWELLNNPEADYYKSISEKIVELERKREDISSFIDFAKTIKLTGMIHRKMLPAEFLLRSIMNKRQIGRKNVKLAR